MSRHHRQVKRPPMIPDIELFQRYHWRQFINSPGMYEKLQGFIRTIKSKRETIDIDLSLSADEFQPISESSKDNLAIF